jgi:hypothetical protein
VEVVVAVVPVVVDFDFSELQEMMLRLIKDIKMINVNFFIITVLVCLVIQEESNIRAKLFEYRATENVGNEDGFRNATG